MSELKLNEYLKLEDLTQGLKLSDEFSFHWTNWDETCLKQRKFYKNYGNHIHLTKLNKSLLDLKNTPVWICNKLKIVKLDLYAVYESYLDSRMRLTWFERKEEFLYSFESEQGPYHLLTSMKWFDKTIYNKFVIRKILLDFMTLRSFRLNSTINVTTKLENDVRIYEQEVQLHQLSEYGIIFKFGDKNLINKIKNAKWMELSIPLEKIIQTDHLSFDDTWRKLNEKSELGKEREAYSFKLDARILNYYGNLINSKRSGDREFYLFCRYEDLIPVKKREITTTALRGLVIKTKEQFLDDLKKVS